MVAILLLLAASSAVRALAAWIGAAQSLYGRRRMPLERGGALQERLGSPENQRCQSFATLNPAPGAADIGRVDRLAALRTCILAAVPANGRIEANRRDGAARLLLCED